LPHLPFLLCQGRIISHANSAATSTGAVTTAVAAETAGVVEAAANVRMYSDGTIRMFDTENHSVIATIDADASVVTVSPVEFRIEPYQINWIVEAEEDATIWIEWIAAVKGYLSHHSMPSSLKRKCTSAQSVLMWHRFDLFRMIEWASIDWKIPPEIICKIGMYLFRFN
jgi:hypothetical protein